jgi:hypothetical protein
VSSCHTIVTIATDSAGGFATLGRASSPHSPAIATSSVEVASAAADGEEAEAGECEQESVGLGHDSDVCIYIAEKSASKRERVARSWSNAN